MSTTLGGGQPKLRPDKWRTSIERLSSCAGTRLVTGLNKKSRNDSVNLIYQTPHKFYLRSFESAL